MEILELKEEIAEKEKDFIAKEKELNWLYETSMAEASGNIKVWHVRARRWAVILMFYWKSQCQTCFLRRRRRSWANRGRNFLTYRSSYFEPERAVNLTKSEEFFFGESEISLSRWRWWLDESFVWSLHPDPSAHLHSWNYFSPSCDDEDYHLTNIVNIWQTSICKDKRRIKKVIEAVL